MSDINYTLTIVGFKNIIRVSLGRKKVGEIRKVDGGYAYKPIKGSFGETFATVKGVKRSLEDE